MKIAHLADIHIRNTQFHKEYKQVFDELYKSLKSNKPDVIYIGGDLFHSKQVLSPESVSLASEFLSKLSEIAHVLIILGNHDVAVSSKEQRLDAISPIIKLIGSHRITYMKESNIWRFNDVYFIHYSCIDNIIPDISSIPQEATKAILYHGIVKGAKTYSGIEFDETTDSRQIIWSDYDMGLLGDIHMVQNVTDNAYYPSSLICQNFGEHPTNHGYILWDTENLNKKPKYIKIENPYSYYTFNYSRGILQSDDKVKFSDVPSTSNLRIFYDPSDKLADVKEEVRKYFPDNTSIIYRKRQIYGLSKGEVKVKQDIIDLYTKENLLSLVDEYNASESSQIRGEIRDLTGRIFDENVEKMETRGNRKSYKLLDLSFSNTFAYGEDNRIDFTKLSGIVGLSAPNRTGKSSFLNTIPFSIFGNFPRMGKVENVFNNNSSSYNTEVELQMDDSKFKIVRGGKRTKKTISNVLTFDETVLSTGENINHTLDANATKNNIRDKFGDLDTYLRSAYIYQNSNDLFLNMTPTPRMDWISKNLGTEIFDILNNQAKSESKEQAGKIKEYESRDFVTEEIMVTKKLNAYKDELKIVNETLKDSDDTIAQIQQQKNVVVSQKLPEPTPSQIRTLSYNKEEIELLIRKNDAIELTTEELKLKQNVEGFQSSDSYLQHVRKIILIEQNKEELNLRKDFEQKKKIYEDAVKIALKTGKENSDLFKIKENQYNELKAEFEGLESYDSEQLNHFEGEYKRINSEIVSFENIVKSNKNSIISLKKETQILSEDERFTNETLCKSCPLLKNAFANETKIKDLQQEIEVAELEVNRLNKTKIELEDSLSRIRLYNDKKLELKMNSDRLEILREKRQNLLDKYNTTKEQLKSFEQEYERMVQSKVQMLDEQITQLKNHESLLYESYLSGLQNTIDSNINKVQSMRMEISKLKIENKQIEELLENVEKNKDKNLQISQLDDEINELKQRSRELSETRDELNKNISVYEYKIEEIEKDKNRLQQLYAEYEVYDKFIKMTSRNELPLTIIKKSLNKMEENINEVLSKVTDFTIELFVENNSVEAIANSPTRGKWTTDLLSGMESFIVNLAFRIGMMEIANIPLPNFMVIDEGLSAFDYENSQKIPQLFDYLKEIFDFVLVVSHNDYMNDFVDTQLVIQRNNERSNLRYD
jgi:DNA repair protein SbcC/Rad50